MDASDSSGTQMSNEARAFILAAQAISDGNKAQTDTSRWVIAVLSIITCVTGINLCLAWQIEADIGKQMKVTNDIAKALNVTQSQSVTVERSKTPADAIGELAEKFRQERLKHAN